MMQTLFNGKLEYDSTESLKKYLSELDMTSAKAVVELALNYAHSKGVFSLQEAGVISIALNELNGENRSV
jgi:hypothetical protein